jgi:hypothetical protein
LREDTPIVSESKSESESVREFVKGLHSEERTLLVIRDELYGGSWDEMVKDLEARRQAKPYVFKLATRIEDDLVRIRRMRDFEQKHSVNLKDHV